MPCWQHQHQSYRGRAILLGEIEEECDGKKGGATPPLPQFLAGDFFGFSFRIGSCRHVSVSKAGDHLYLGIYLFFVFF